MASHVVFGLLLTIFCFFPLWSEATQTRVDLTSPVDPVTVGGVFALQCQVWNMKDSYKVNIFRVVNGDIEQLKLINI